MAETLAVFSRGPFEEVRVSLVRRADQNCLEIRVYHKPLGGGPVLPTGEIILVPEALLDKLLRALQLAGETLRRRTLEVRDEPPLVQMEGGDAKVVGAPPSAPPRPAPPAPARFGVMAHGRADRRIPLNSPLEYAVRGKQGQTGEWRNGRTKDINRIGMQVVLPERIPVLTTVLLTLQLNDGPLSVMTEVVWAQLARGLDMAAKGCCHGVRFIALGPAELQRIQRLLHEDPSVTR
jgi:hypothetical protein